MISYTRSKRVAKRWAKAAFDAGAVISNGMSAKTAFEALALATSEHTDGNAHAPGLDYRKALQIVLRAKREGLDSFDLWLVFDAYVCDDLDEAVRQLRAMHKTYEDPPVR